MPPEDAEAENDDTSDQKMTDKAAAAAAIAVAQAEADELAKTDEQKPK
jgi:hypothetical protein